jgi:hypothetical protein
MKELHKKYPAYILYSDGAYTIKPLPQYNFLRRLIMAIDVLRQEATVVYYPE